MYAYEKGLKGITIFRDGCKRIGILNTSDKKETKKLSAGEGLKRGEILLVTDDVVGKKRKLTNRLRKPCTVSRSLIPIPEHCWRLI